MLKRFFAALLSCLLFGVTVFADEASPAEKTLDCAIKSAGASSVQEWLDGALSDGAGMTSEWWILALRQYLPELDFSAYADSLERYLDTSPAVNSAGRRKYALALIAAGREDSPYISEVMSEELDGQGIMSLVYTLHLLNNGCFSGKYTAADVISAVGKLRLPDGGWAVMGHGSDVDVTAMTLQALAPYRDEYPDMISGALDFLSASQLPDGGFRSMGAENSESAAQAVIALVSLGIDPLSDGRFIGGDNTAVSSLESFRLPDGSFSHTADGGSSALATVQAFSALAAMEKGGSFYIFDKKDTAGEAPEAAESAVIAEAQPVEVQEAELRTDKTSYKPVVCAAILGAGVLACLLLFLLGKRHVRNFIFAAALCAAGIAFVLLTDFRSAEDYYVPENISSEDIAGSAFISVSCETVAGAAEHIPADGIILPRTEVDFREGAAVSGVLISAARANGLKIGSRGAGTLYYVSSIEGLSEFDFGDLSGWMYFVNGESPSVGCGEYRVSDGDVIEWKYTRDIGNDLR